MPKSKNILLYILATFACFADANDFLISFLDFSQNLNNQIKGIHENILTQSSSVFNSLKDISMGQYKEKSEKSQIKTTIYSPPTLSTEEIYISEKERMNFFFKESQQSKEVDEEIIEFIKQAKQGMNRFLQSNQQQGDDLYEQYYFKNKDNQIIAELYLKEFWIGLYLQSPRPEESSFDSVYANVPAQLVYTKIYQGKEYRIIKLKGDCDESSQKVITKAYWYICNNKKMFILWYFYLLNQGHPCEKKEYYQESCLCPQDKLGLYCNEQVHLNCDASLKIGDRFQNRNPENDTESIKKDGIQYIFTRNLLHTDIYTESILFSSYLSCRNSIDINHMIHQRFQVISGMCPDNHDQQQKPPQQQPEQCEGRQFEYKLLDTKNGIMLTGGISINQQVQISNWNRISQPLLLNTLMQSVTTPMITGKVPLDLSIDLTKLSNSIPDESKLNINDYLQYGKIWYSYQVRVTEVISNYTTQEYEIQKQSGVLIQSDYNIPMNTFLMRLRVGEINKTEITIIVAIIVCIIAGIWQIKNIIDRKNKNSKKNTQVNSYAILQD